MGETSGTALCPILYEDAKWDLATMSYADWLDFIFRHPAKTDKDRAWYWEEEWEYKISDNRTLLDYLIKLFSNSMALSEQYSDEQLEQGFWFVMGPAGFSDVVWDDKIDLAQRLTCVRCQAAIFRDLFAEHPLDTSVYVWWDLFESGYRCNEQPVNADDAAIQESILYTLGDILGMEPWHCVGSALHGLNHLHHPRVPEFIDYFLATKRGLAEEIISYALLCREGKAL